MNINTSVLMSGADYFDDHFEINPYMDQSVSVDTARAIIDHANIKNVLEAAGIEITKVNAPKDCQDGVYTANWGLCFNNSVILSALPNKRHAEQPYAKEVLSGLGKKLIKPPNGLRFSGQGDNLICGQYLLAGSNYRTDAEIHKFLAEQTGLLVVSLQTVPLIDKNGKDVINQVTGWPDSFFYDIDLAIAVLDEDTIAWCPDAFLPYSQDKIAKLSLNKIEVSLEEAVKGLACNLVSTGKTVIMSAHAPLFASQLELYGYRVVTPEVNELQKGGGFIRCTTLTI